MQTHTTLLSQENRSRLLANAHRFVCLYIFLVLCAYLAAFYIYVGSFRQQLSVETAKTYLTALTTLHQYYSNEIVHRARAAGAQFAHDYKNYPDRIPFPGTVAVDFGDRLEKVAPQLSFSLYSDYPFPWRRDRVLSTRTEVLNHFLGNVP